MREVTFSSVILLGACVPATTGTGIADDEIASEGDVPSETGAESSTDDSESESSSTETGDDSEPQADDSYADAIDHMTYGRADLTTMVVEAYAEDATSLARFEFSIQEKVFGSLLLIRADFPDMHAKWLMHPFDGVTAIISPQEAPVIQARAEVIGKAIAGLSDLSNCAKRIAKAVAACATSPLSKACPTAFELTYCECRVHLVEAAELSCL